jgi:hypothetical protein
MPSRERLQKEATRVIRLLRITPFEQCTTLEKGFANLSFQAGIYAIKSDEAEILYVGMTSAFRTRFQNGHQALLKILISGVPAVKLRILPIPIDSRYVDYLLQLEKQAIFAIQPRYNVRMPSSQEIASMVATTTTTTTENLSEVLQYLPRTIVNALEDHADTYGLSDNQVLEMAIAQFLDLDVSSFDALPKLKGLAALKAENEILKLRLEAAGLPTEINAEIP